MSGRLEGKNAIVTGGGRGLGRAIALGFAREGANVVIAEIDPQTGNDTVGEIEKLGRKAVNIKTDVSRKSDIDAMVAQAIATFGRIDILMNNAGIHVAAPFLEVSEELYDRTLNTNLKSQFFCAQAVARHMVEQGGGKIINTSSISAEIADPGASHYCVGKGGVQMLTRAAALELAQHNVQVNAIAPGTFKTKLTPWYDEQDSVDYCKKFVPAGRFAQPEELVGAAILLASSDSSYMNGTTIVVDGGLMTQ